MSLLLFQVQVLVSPCTKVTISCLLTLLDSEVLSLYLMALAAFRLSAWPPARACVTRVPFTLHGLHGATSRSLPRPTWHGRGLTVAFEFEFEASADEDVEQVWKYHVMGRNQRI
jgi:hypothetical protein